MLRDTPFQRKGDAVQVTCADDLQWKPLTAIREGGKEMKELLDRNRRRARQLPAGYDSRARCGRDHAAPQAQLRSSAHRAQRTRELRPAALDRTGRDRLLSRRHAVRPRGFGRRSARAHAAMRRSQRPGIRRQPAGTSGDRRRSKRRANSKAGCTTRPRPTRSGALRTASKRCGNTSTAVASTTPNHATTNRSR